jgi:hypothetical protein
MSRDHKKPKHDLHSDSSTTQSLLQSDSSAAMDWDTEGAHGSSSSSSSSLRHPIVQHAQPLQLSDKHMEIAARHPGVIKSNNQVIQVLGKKKLESFHEAKQLIKAGIHPTIQTDGVLGSGANAKYSDHVLLLKHLSPSSERYVHEARQHVQDLQDHPHRELLAGAEDNAAGVAEAHSWTKNHPHEATTAHEFLNGMEPAIQKAKIAAIEAAEQKVHARMKAHLP